MNRFVKCLLIIVSSFVVCIPAIAGDEGISSGSIKVKDFDLIVCPVDSSAPAYYVFDKGTTRFIYTLGFSLIHKRQLRIKILDNTASEQAEFKFELFKGEENIESINGTVYNLVKGKVKTSKLRKSQITRKSKNKYYDVVTFTLPNVKKGSIMDVTYTLTSGSMIKLFPWKFQYDIPVLYSNYSVEIPEYFKYLQYNLGNIPYELAQYSSDGLSDYSTNTGFRFIFETLGYTAKDVPAYVADTPPTVLEDYPGAIEFALTYTNLPTMYEDIRANDFSNPIEQIEVPQWEGVVERLCNSSDFGVRLEAPNFGDEAETIKTSVKDSISKLHAAVHTIKTSTEWNGEYSLYSMQSIEETLKDGEGNAADINLALVGLLREIGLEAYPVILKTVDKGFVREYNPTPQQFNYVIASCRINGKLYLIDACDEDAAINRLPKHCQNGYGLLFDAEKYEWIVL